MDQLDGELLGSGATGTGPGSGKLVEVNTKTTKAQLCTLVVKKNVSQRVSRRGRR